MGIVALGLAALCQQTECLHPLITEKGRRDFHHLIIGCLLSLDKRGQLSTYLGALDESAVIGKDALLGANSSLLCLFVPRCAGNALS